MMAAWQKVERKMRKTAVPPTKVRRMEDIVRYRERRIQQKEARVIFVQTEFGDVEKAG